LQIVCAPCSIHPGSTVEARRQLFFAISLYMTSVKDAAGRFPCAFTAAGVVDSPITCFTSSMDLPYATIALTLSHLFWIKASFFLTSSLVIRPPSSVT
jgi:hypothetical protein